MTQAPPGASYWESKLFEMVREHVDSEADVESKYRKLAAESGAADVRYLINLILEDEERHHRWLGQLASSVRALSTGERDTEIPWVGHLDDRQALREATKEFLRIEREDLRSLRQLKKELKDVEHTTLWGLLVHLMLLDTEKHIEILQFIARRARGA